MHIVNVGYASANYYVLGQGRGRLLVDVGFPGTLPRLLASLKRKGIALSEIAHLLVTHYHPDHGGLAQELVEQGVRLLVLEVQAAGVAKLKNYVKPGDGYVEIRLEQARRLAAGESRAFLRTIGIQGEIIHTPGHSDDSVTLVLDSGEAFTGDLESPQWAREEVMGDVKRSWAQIRALGAKQLYPGHGPVRLVEN